MLKLDLNHFSSYNENVSPQVPNKFRRGKFKEYFAKKSFAGSTLKHWKLITADDTPPPAAATTNTIADTGTVTATTNSVFAVGSNFYIKITTSRHLQKQTYLQGHQHVWIVRLLCIDKLFYCLLAFSLRLGQLTLRVIHPCKKLRR